MWNVKLLNHINNVVILIEPQSITSEEKNNSYNSTHGSIDFQSQSYTIALLSISTAKGSVMTD